MSAARHLEPIIIVEDSEVEAMLLERALQRNQVVGPIIRLANGLEAIKYLSAAPPYNDRKTHPLPRLIITDLEMPYMDGFEVVSAVRIHVQCCVVPVIVLSSSSRQSDIYKAYQLGANSYIVKPHNLEEMTRIIGVSMQYWNMCAKPEVGY